MERNRSNWNALAVVGQRHVSVKAILSGAKESAQFTIDRVIVVVEVELKSIRIEHTSLDFATR